MEPIKKLVKQAITQIERERDHFATSLNITGTQMSVFDYLSNMPNYTASQNEIEQEFDIRRSTTTIMVQRMEKRGLIERIASPDDKRQKLVKLTQVWKHNQTENWRYAQKFANATMQLLREN